MKKENILPVLYHSTLFHSLSKEQILFFLQQPEIRLRHYQTGQRIFEENETPSFIYQLISGSIRIAKDTMDGRRQLIHTVDQPGDLFAEVYAFLQVNSYAMYAEAIEDCDVLSFPVSLLTESPNSLKPVTDIIKQQLLTIFAGKAFRLQKQIRILGGGGLQGKIARYLLLNADADGTVRIKRDAMAGYLHTARPSLSRALGQLKEDGYITLNGRLIQIISRQALSELA